MDEFVKVSSGKKQILILIENLKGDDMLEVIPDRKGESGTYFVRIISKKTVGKEIKGF